PLETSRWCAPGQLLQQVFERVPHRLGTAAFMTRIGGLLDKLSPADQVEWQTSLQTMLDDHETVLRDQKRLEERLNPDPLTASFEDRAERLSLDFEEASCHYANCEESEDCYACGRQRNGRCEEHDSSKPWEEAADAKEDLYHAAHELKSVIIDWSKHLISQLADPSSRTVETCSNVLDGVMDMIEHWGYAAEADCVQNQDTIIWPEKEPWPKPGDDDEDSDWDIPAIICRLCRDVLLCILAIEHSLPASDSATRQSVDELRQRALAHMNAQVAYRLPPRGGVVGVLLHDQEASGHMPEWHDAADNFE
ncbi:unnamed protein product, partial [Tilletia caries]